METSCVQRTTFQAPTSSRTTSITIRSIAQANTSQSLPLSMRSAFTTNTTTNQLNAPTGYSFAYDAAGNQYSDNYGDGSGTSYSRTFDADNHMINSTSTY